jgi:thiol-disulfide isomerase/thioredoxin
MKHGYEGRLADRGVQALNCAVKSLPFIILMCVCSVSAFARNDAGMVGQELPDLRLNFFGRKADYDGKPLLLEFWATWCPPCRESIPHLNDLHEKYKDRGLVIIGVTEEPDAVIRKFQKNMPMEYAVATDSTGRLAAKMGVEGIPHAFLVDTSGKIVWDGHPMSLREEQIENLLGGESPEETGSASETEAPEAVEAETPGNAPEATAVTADAPSAQIGAEGAIQAEDTASMESKVGSEVIIEGVVRSVGKGPNDGITFINFGDRGSGFVAVAFRSVYGQFPDGFDKYSGQKVRVRGSLEKYQDRQLQIRISTPDQIEIVGVEEASGGTP